jgi:hypothetical protein
MTAIVIISGLFCVRNGAPEFHRSRHIVYESAFLTTDDETYSLTIRYYDPNGHVLPDKTLVYIVGKLFITLGETPYLEPIEFLSFPGDPSDTDYEDNFPSPEPPTILALGPVSSQLHQSGDGGDQNWMEFGVDSLGYCTKTGANQLTHTE